MSDMELKNHLDTLKSIFKSSLSMKNNTNKQVKINVVKLIYRILYFYGYKIDTNKNISKIHKSQNNFLENDESLKLVIYILKFLKTLDMLLLLNLLLLCICERVSSDLILNQNLENNGFLNTCRDIYKKSLSNVINGLKNFSNSCYIDSVLVALFASENKFIDDNILNKDLRSEKLKLISCNRDGETDLKIKQNIQHQLILISNSIKKKSDVVIEKCKDLRKLFKYCSVGSDFSSSSTEDSGEFLQYLFGLFNINCNIIKKTTYFTNNLVPHIPKGELILSSNISENFSPVLPISVYSILEKKRFNTSDFINQVEDAILDENNLYNLNGTKYMRRIEIKTLTKAEDYLVFYVQRLLLKKRVYTEIFPDPKIFNLKLSAVVVHKQNHYVCYFCKGGIWFLFNDLSSEIEVIGFYKQLLQHEEVLKYSVLYFYS
jgi:hypothetical protein